jgi:3-methyl-2-oxobutanoate hydroxymethyltransferase
VEAFQAYAADARAGRFPADEHTYKMVEGELPKLTAMLKK